jgi:hypothetical protein
MDRSTTILLIIVAVLVGGFIVYPAYIGGGFATISLSQTKFISTDSDLGGEAWQLTAVQNSQGEYAIGEISADKITDGESIAKHPLKIEMFVDEQYVTYPIVKNTDYHSQFHTANYESKEISHIDFSGQQDFRDDCSNRPTAFYLTEKDYGIIYNKVFTCYWKSQDATLGTVTTKDTNFKSRIKVTVDNKVAEGTISNTGPSSVKLKNPNTDEHLAHASWLGNLVSGEEPPAPSAFNLVAYKGGWKNIDDQRYDDYKDYYNTGFENCIARYLNYDTETPQSCVNDWNDIEASALENFPIYFNDKLATTSGTETTGKFIINLPKQIQYPLITLKIKADWLGVYIPIGIPTITNVEAPSELQTGTIGYLTITVKNIGEGSGAFEVYASCIGASQGPTQYLNLEPNIQGTAYISLVSSTTTKTSYSCTVNARDRNSGEMAAPKTVSGFVTPIIICSTGDKRINGKNIEQCDADGSGWEIIDTCQEGYHPEWKGGNPECVKDEPTPPPGEICNQINPFDKFMCQAWQFVKLIVGLIIGAAIIIGALYVLVTMVLPATIAKILSGGRD